MSLLPPAPFHTALPVDDALFHEVIYLTHAGWEDIAPGKAYPNTDHPSFYYFKWEEGRVMPSFNLAMVFEGGGEFETRRHRRVLKAGDCFLILPGEWHRHRPDPATGWKMAWVEFNGTLAFDWWRSGALGSPSDFPAVAHRDMLKAQFGRLLGDVRAAPSRNSTHYSRQLIGLMSHIVKDTGDAASEKGAGDDPVEKAVACIWNYSHGVLDVPAVARHAGIGRGALERKFRARKGRGILDEIHRCRFERASRLLTETDIPIKLVVERAGFGSQERMRLVFHKLAGKSPERFRNDARPPDKDGARGAKGKDDAKRGQSRPDSPHG